jgi:hypothetical protein
VVTVAPRMVGAEEGVDCVMVLVSSP